MNVKVNPDGTVEMQNNNSSPEERYDRYIESLKQPK